MKCQSGFSVVICDAINGPIRELFRHLFGERALCLLHEERDLGRFLSLFWTPRLCLLASATWDLTILLVWARPVASRDDQASPRLLLTADPWVLVEVSVQSTAR